MEEQNGEDGMPSKVAVLPCTGIGQVVGTIARQAAYRVCEDLKPQETLLVCLPALVKGVQEDIDMIENFPTVVIEGCKERCATYALKRQGGKPAAEVFIPDVLKGGQWSIRRQARCCLTEAEESVAALVGDKTAEQVDLLRGGQGDA